jgi:hypothetical protein
VEADVFRPQSLGRAVRTAFVLGVLIVIALVAAVASFHQFNALVGDNTKDEMSRYLDDHEHTTVKPGGAGFKIDFPVPPTHDTELVSTGVGGVTARRYRSLVDDEATFDVVWFDAPKVSVDPSKVLSTLISLQVHQIGGTQIAAADQERIDGAISRDFVYRRTDTDGAKRFYDQRIIMQGRRVWFVRVGSRLRRDEAFRVFAASFTLTG